MPPKKSAAAAKDLQRGGFSDDKNSHPPARTARSAVTLQASRPLLMVDIDGVISLFGAPPGALQRGARDGSLHSIDGMPHFLSSSAAAHLLALAELYDVVWASGWEERANEHLPRLLGLPPALPFLRFERDVARSHAHWKLDAIERFAASRPLAWIDDSFNAACHQWASARQQPTLLVATDPAQGLTAREAQLLARWAAQQRTPYEGSASAACTPSDTAAP